MSPKPCSKGKTGVLPGKGSPLQRGSREVPGQTDAARAPGASRAWASYCFPSQRHLPGEEIQVAAFELGLHPRETGQLSRIQSHDHPRAGHAPTPVFFSRDASPYTQHRHSSAGNRSGNTRKALATDPRKEAPPQETAAKAAARPRSSPESRLPARLTARSPQGSRSLSRWTVGVPAPQPYCVPASARRLRKGGQERRLLRNRWIVLRARPRFSKIPSRTRSNTLWAFARVDGTGQRVGGATSRPQGGEHRPPVRLPAESGLYKRD